jgi:hypothetical protein
MLARPLRDPLTSRDQPPLDIPRPLRRDRRVNLLVPSPILLVLLCASRLTQHLSDFTVVAAIPRVALHLFGFLDSSEDGQCSRGQKDQHVNGQLTVETRLRVEKRSGPEGESKRPRPVTHAD